MLLYQFLFLSGIIQKLTQMLRYMKIHVHLPDCKYVAHYYYFISIVKLSFKLSNINFIIVSRFCHVFYFAQLFKLMDTNVQTYTSGIIKVCAFGLKLYCIIQNVDFSYWCMFTFFDISSIFL